jgi:tetratricopeptide (TPR) repeat protein
LVPLEIHFMKKTGRNAPCPCGSGKKYKMCCLKREEDKSPLIPPPPQPTFFEDDIDRDSNRVVDLIHEGRLKEAEEAAQRLLHKYPDLPDGLERTAAVLEARGEKAQAAEYYQKAAEKFLENDPDYGHESAEFCRKKAEELGGDATDQE